MTDMKKNKKSPRRRAREFTVQALYQAAINDTAAPEIANHFREHGDFKHADADLFAALFFGAHRNHQEYMNLVYPHIDRDANAINPIERSILLMAIHELKEMPETPYPVIINEAIEVTKTFGGTDSHKFINGILDKLAEELRPNDIKNKSS
jgi:transcription antitermination factor nusB